ncbi:hypothetical protein [Mycolicibacterium komossense]|uniref:Uncharacterized protein n=1 Tax=Mycolicibacterium komossense TaxID=1779 RepID=A0ABT3CBA8_9MYCO|nr:hypothetical protein [Mycolicibacterium komossense]MCV7226691.1 hypothetical protein [Mycolicibacterium komossense]
MRVVAFAPSLSAVYNDAGGVDTKGFPMTSCYVKSFPSQLTVPMVVAFYALGGADYDPVRYIVATSPAGERVGSLEFGWHWDDNPPNPVKFRVLVQYLPMRVEAAGPYSIGLYDSLDATETDHLFPLPVLKTDPYIRTRTQ